jgi:hypothetical protein
MTGIGGIHCVFSKDNRVVVSKGDALAAVFLCGYGGGFWRSLIQQSIHVSGFTDVPVLAKFTGQVTTRCTKGEYAAARVEIV